MCDNGLSAVRFGLRLFDDSITWGFGSRLVVGGLDVDALGWIDVGQ